MKKLYEKYLIEFKKGWTKSSIEKFGKTIGKSPDEKGFFNTCLGRLSKHMDDDTAKGMCASMKDVKKGSTYWRGKGKSEKKSKEDTKKHQNVKGLVKGKVIKTQ